MSQTTNDCDTETALYLARMHPLHDAVCDGKIQVIKCLIEEMDFFVNSQTFDLVTPLHQACFYGQKEAVYYLLQKGAVVNARNIDGATPLCDACCYGDVDLVQLLLKHGADVNPPLLMSSPLHEAVLRGYSEITDLLVKAGANIHATDSHYGTPLHITAFRGDRACAGILLRAGADVNCRQFHKTPIHDVARQQDYDFLYLLLDHGANVYAQDNQGHHPRDLIPSNTSPAKQLLHYYEAHQEFLSTRMQQHARTMVGQSKQWILWEAQAVSYSAIKGDWMKYSSVGGHLLSSHTSESEAEDLITYMETNKEPVEFFKDGVYMVKSK